LVLVYACFAWIAGLYIGWKWSVPSTWLLVGIPCVAIVIWLLGQYRAARLAAILALIALFGMLRIDLVQPHTTADTVAYYNGEQVRLVGVVSDRPDERDTRMQVQLSVEALSTGMATHAVHGEVLVTTPAYRRIGYGDRLLVRGVLQEPPVFEDFSYRDYLASRNIYSIMAYPELEVLGKGCGNPFFSVLHALHDRLRAVIYQILPDPEAGLLNGILLGVYDALPQRVLDSFNATGTSHIIVISGFNITILATILLRIFNQWLSRPYAAKLAIVGIWFYTLLVGADAAVVRAALMGSAVLAAALLGRVSHALTSLALAVFLMTLAAPLALWDVGFQLSVGATLGLILFASSLFTQTQRVLSGYVLSRSVLPLLQDTVTATLAAQIFALPILLYHFQRLSLVMPLANVLILPVQPALMGSGAIAVIVGCLWLPAGRALGGIAWLFLTYTIRVVELLAAIPFAAVDIGRFPAALLWGYFAVVLVSWWVRQMEVERRQAFWQAATRFLSTKVIVSGLVAICLLLWAAVFSLPDGLLHVRVLDVGQGDAILVTLPDGQQLLIDGGPSPLTLSTELGRAMPFWDHNIELVVLSHPDKDHLGGLLAALERYHVDQVLDSAVDDDAPATLHWRELLAENNIQVQQACAGMRIDLGNGVAMEVLHPPPAGSATLKSLTPNDASTVLRMTYGAVSFLFTGDLEAKGELTLLHSGSPIASDVLKVSHHGAAEATTADFIQAVSPQLAVISVGPNRFGHPASETLKRLEHGTVLRTDLYGTIDIRTDGVTCWADKSP